MAKKSIEVGAAIIKDKDRILSTQRGYGDYKDWWEFPGGKLEEGETAAEAVRREIREELNVEISIGEKIDTVQYEYPEFYLTMHCFLCTIKEGKPELLEHEAAKWLSKEDLDSVKWLEADLPVKEKLKKIL